MKKYYVQYYRDFANTYTLAYAETPEQLAIAEKEGWQQITREKALSLARAESVRQEQDQAFSGYASSTIIPIDSPGDAFLYNDRRYELVGRIWQRI